MAQQALLLLCDTPNCDLYPAQVRRGARTVARISRSSVPRPPHWQAPCSTGSLAGDTEAWWADLDALGLASHAWGVWDAVDGGAAQPNFYGDLANDGSGLTAKGVMHQQRAQQAGDAGHRSH